MTIAAERETPATQCTTTLPPLVKIDCILSAERSKCEDKSSIGESSI